MTRTVTIPLSAPVTKTTVLLAKPAAALRNGQLVAFPTETVYGLGADATNPDAVKQIFRAKGRPNDNPLIVHVASMAWLPQIVKTVSPLATRLGERYWPGPLTLVFDANDAVPSVTTAGLSSVAVRVPAHPVARVLIETAGVPVAAPSANISGRPSPTTADHVHADLDGKIEWIVDGGPCTVGIESTVVDARGDVPVVLRKGGVSRSDLAAVAGTVGHEHGSAASPGTRHAHYQPTAEVIVAEPGQAEAIANAHAAQTRTGLVGTVSSAASNRIVVLATPDPDVPEQLGSVLYTALRQADDQNLDVVVVEACTEKGFGAAVLDRLHRAASPR